MAKFKFDLEGLLTETALKAIGLQDKYVEEALRVLISKGLNLQQAGECLTELAAIVKRMQAEGGDANG